jgi:hypothetical protein
LTCSADPSSDRSIPKAASSAASGVNGPEAVSTANPKTDNPRRAAKSGLSDGPKIFRIRAVPGGIVVAGGDPF